MNLKRLCPDIRDIILQGKEKKGQHIPLKQELLTLANGMVGLEMVMAYKCGQMELGMKVIIFFGCNQL